METKTFCFTRSVSLLFHYAIASVMYVMPHPNPINPTHDHLNDGICVYQEAVRMDEGGLFVKFCG